MKYPASLCALALAAAHPAMAEQLWVGAYAHDVTPLSSTDFESGADVQFGWRGNGIDALRVIGRPAPYALVGINLGNGTDYAAAGLSWRWGSQLYIRPGIGIAIHDGPSLAVRGNRRVDLGSRVLFEPELAAGIEIGPRLSAELSWVHMSHARLFDHQNRGMDNFGVRLVWTLP
jgi:hypothetical protein